MASFQFQPPRAPVAPVSRAPARVSPQAAANAAALIRQRSTPRAADAILTALARAWFEALPLRPRPEQLCARYPRVANRLALCWAERELADRLFDDLLVDKRGGRKGFPPPVLAELRLLRDFNATRRPAPPQNDGVWSEEMVNR